MKFFYNNETGCTISHNREKKIIIGLKIIGKQLLKFLRKIVRRQ